MIDSNKNNSISANNTTTVKYQIKYSWNWIQLLSKLVVWVILNHHVLNNLWQIFKAMLITKFEPLLHWIMQDQRIWAIQRPVDQIFHDFLPWISHYVISFIPFLKFIVTFQRFLTQPNYKRCICTRYIINN